MVITHGIAIFLSVALMTFILFLVYKRMLREEYSLLWLIGGIVLVIISFFQSLLTRIASLLDISYYPSLLFVIAILFVVIIVLSQAISITTLIKRDRDLAQKTAILEWRLEQHLEEQAKNNASPKPAEQSTSQD